jgi:nitroreductase
MPVVQSTPLRVFPQTVGLPLAPFTQAPDPLAGMQAFEHAAKLPLLMEQIKLEKARGKVEADKLKLAEMEAKWQQDNFSALQQASMDAARLTSMEKQASIVASNAQAAERLANAEVARAGLGTVPTSGLSQLEQDTMTPALPALEDEAVSAAGGAPLSNEPPLQGVPEGQKEVVARPVTAVENWVKDPAIAPVMGSLPLVTPGSKEFSSLTRGAEQKATQTAVAVHGREVALKDYGAVKKTKEDALVRQSPKLGELELTTSTGIPIVVPAWFSENEPVAVAGVPRLNSEKLSETQKKIDNAAAEVVGGLQGGGSDRMLNSNLTQLSFAEEMLDEKKGMISGGVVSLIPNWFRARWPGLQVGVAVEDAVKSVVQQSLRQTLGAQFARIEGEMMMNRAFDPKQSPEENTRRLRILKDELISYAQNKQAAADYYAANETMKGFKGQDLAEAARATRESYLSRVEGGGFGGVGASGAPRKTSETPGVKKALADVRWDTVQ